MVNSYTYLGVEYVKGELTYQVGGYDCTTDLSRLWRSVWGCPCACLCVLHMWDHWLTHTCHHQQTYWGRVSLWNSYLQWYIMDVISITLLPSSMRSQFSSTVVVLLMTNYTRDWSVCKETRSKLLWSYMYTSQQWHCHVFNTCACDYFPCLSAK